MEESDYPMGENHFPMGESLFPMGESLFLRGKTPIRWGKVFFQRGKTPILWEKIIFQRGKPPSSGGKQVYEGEEVHPIKISYVRGTCIPCQQPKIRAHRRHISALPSNYSLSPLHGNITSPFIAFLHIVLIKSLKEAW
jgi:hypothetical protein